MDTIHVLKQWSSIKPELQLLHSVIVERDIQDIGSLVDEIYRSDLKKELLNSLFLTLRLNSREANSSQTVHCLTVEIVQKGLQYISSSDFPDADDLVALLVDNSNHMQPEEAQYTIQHVLKAFKSGAVSCLQLLPGLLNLVTSTESAQSRGAGTSSNCIKKLVTDIIQAGWQPKETARVVSMLRDISMLGRPEKLLLMQHALKVAARGDVQDLPSIAHQVLLLCSQENTAETLLGLIKLIQKQETRVLGNEPLLRQLVQVAGTILLDIEITIKLVMQGKAWMTNLKPQNFITPFSIGVLCTLASIPRLQQSAWDILKGTVVRALQDSERREISRWMSTLPRLPLTDAMSIEACTIKALDNCALGWTMIVQPVLTLATELMDGAGKRGSGFSASMLGDGLGATAAARAAHMGVQLAKSIFAKHPPARSEILSMCLARLICPKEEQSLPYLRLLALLVQEHSALVATQLSYLKELVELLPSLDVHVALGLMLAIWPLCRKQRAVKEQLIMVLRKAMFRPDVGARLLAVRGFLFLVLQELQTTVRIDDCAQSSSQVSLSQCDSLSAAGSGASLLQELTGFLRRSLTHQAPVREALYMGMLEVVGADPLAHDALVELLLPRLCHYFEADQTLPPLQIGKCASLQKGESRLIEPIGALLLAVRAVILASDQSIRSASARDNGAPRGLHQIAWDTNASQALLRIFQNIGSRLQNSNLEDWGLDSSADLSTTTSEGLLNRATAGSLLGSLEVYMEDIVTGAVCGWLHMGQAGEQLTSLFSFHHRLSQLAVDQGRKKSKPVASQGKKRARSCNDTGTAFPAVVPLRERQSVLSASCLSRLLHMISDDGILSDPDEAQRAQMQDDADMEALTSLARDASCQAFVLNSSLLYLQSCQAQLPLLAIIAGTRAPDDCKALQRLLGGNDWQTMGAELLKTGQMIVLASMKHSTRNVGGKRKEQDPADGLSLLAVQSMAAVLQLCSSTNELQTVMASFAPDTASATGAGVGDAALQDIEARLHHLRQLLLRLVENRFFKEVEVFCGALVHLSNILPLQTTVRFSKWALDCCKYDDPEGMQPRAIKALVRLLLNSAGATDLEAARLVAEAVLAELDSLGTQSQTATFQSLPVINRSTASSAAAALLSYLESHLQDVDWLLSTLKTGQGTCGGADRAQHSIELEEATFERQGVIMELLSNMLSAAQANALCNSLSRLVLLAYRTLTVAAKLHIVGKGKTRSAPCQAFQDMVTLVLKQLTPAVYDFLTHIQQQISADPDGSDEAPAKLKNEERTIPDIIFNVEDFEKHLIQITCYGHLNLMRFAKRSTNRDWRTIARPLVACKENQAVDGNAASNCYPE